MSLLRRQCAFSGIGISSQLSHPVALEIHDSLFAKGVLPFPKAADKLMTPFAPGLQHLFARIVIVAPKS
jgi:hypothetical protein